MDPIENSLAYLASDEASQSLARDPYWPKWNSPWWHMLLLSELGLAKKIPARAIQAMVRTLRTHYHPTFPIRIEEVPAGADPYRQLACHCAVGSVYQVLFHHGVHVDEELPWLRPWILQYQLPDGGLNCDEKAYTKVPPKSSLVSTLPCLEAIFFCRDRELKDQEMEFLEQGARYLLRQRLFRKVSTGEVIDPKWLEIRFPRFYEYDFLRGYFFLEKWSRFSGLSLPNELVEEVEALVAQQMTPEGLRLRRYNLIDRHSYDPDEKQNWSWGPASEFPLMQAVSYDGAICEVLTQQWEDVRPRRS